MRKELGSLENTKAALHSKLKGLLPPFEIDIKAELVYAINQEKNVRDAIILGHNYMEPALYHGVADIVGDSLQLSRAASETTHPIIVFCGVRFMAETAKTLNPDKMVLLPSLKAGCSLAGSITASDVRTLKQMFPGVPVITYINTYAEVQAECDAICTSSNAVKVALSFDSDKIIFLPDEFLGKNVARETGKQVFIPKILPQGRLEVGELPDSAVMIGWQGKCEVHEQFHVQDIKDARAQYPDVVVLAHPECSPEVVEASDFSGSTSRMIQFVKESPHKRFLVLTECSMGDNIMAENPDKELLRLCSVRCPHMGQITLEETLAALKELKHQIDVPKDIQIGARKALDRMLSIQ